MATPEGKVKDKIKEYLDSLGSDCWYYMPVPMGYGRNGIPDFLICYKGFFLAPETKRAKGGKSEAWQEREQQAINKAGGSSGRVTEVQTIKYWVAKCDHKWAALGLGGLIG